MRSREARLRDGDSTVENIGKEAAQIQWKKSLQRTQAKTKHFKRSVITHLLKTVLSFPKGLYKVKI